jgi:hypothetical protein
MNISQVIELLEHCQQHYGDLPVKIAIDAVEHLMDHEFVSYTFDIDENEIPYILLG